VKDEDGTSYIVRIYAQERADGTGKCLQKRRADKSSRITTKDSAANQEKIREQNLITLCFDCHAQAHHPTKYLDLAPCRGCLLQIKNELSPDELLCLME